MPEFRYFKMIEKYAALISKWKYEEPYSIYSMEESAEDISELLNGDYYYVLNGEEELAAFKVYKQARFVKGPIFNSSI